MVGLVDLQVQAAGLMGGVGFGTIAPGAWPVLQGGLHQLAYAAFGFNGRTEIEV
jgi:hypothetical protein